MSTTTIIRPRARIQQRQKRFARERLTLFTKTKVVALLGLTVCAFALTTWHAHKRPASTTMSTVTVEGTAIAPAITPVAEPTIAGSAIPSASCVPCPAADVPTPAVR